MCQLWTSIITSFDDHRQLVAGTFLGIIPSLVVAIFYDWWKRRSLKYKQHTFIEELNDAMVKYIEIPPVDEDEVITRRQEVATKVKKLSQKIFRKNYPVFDSVRLESTEYPKIDCKWCFREHKAHHGSKGLCKECKLPLDVWIGCNSGHERNVSESKDVSK